MIDKRLPKLPPAVEYRHSLISPPPLGSDLPLDVWDAIFFSISASAGELGRQICRPRSSRNCQQLWVTQILARALAGQWSEKSWPWSGSIPRWFGTHPGTIPVCQATPHAPLVVPCAAPLVPHGEARVSSLAPCLGLGLAKARALTAK